MLTIQSRGNESIDTIFVFGSTRTSISVSERPRASPGRRSWPISRKMTGRFADGAAALMPGSTRLSAAPFSSGVRASVIWSTASRRYQ